MLARIEPIGSQRSPYMVRFTVSLRIGRALFGFCQEILAWLIRRLMKLGFDRPTAVKALWHCPLAYRTKRKLRAMASNVVSFTRHSLRTQGKSLPRLVHGQQSSDCTLLSNRPRQQKRRTSWQPTPGMRSGALEASSWQCLMIVCLALF